MKINDIINQFSDLQYLTKSEIVNKFDELCWREILLYRNSRRVIYPLANSAEQKISIVITPALVNYEINLHKQINKLSSVYQIFKELNRLYQTEDQKGFEVSKIKQEMFSVLKGGYDMSVDETSLDRILKEKQNLSSPEERFSSEYIRFLYALDGHLLHKSIALNTCELNTKLSNVFVKNIFRKRRLKKINMKHIMLSSHKNIDYRGFRHAELEQRLYHIDSMFSDSKVLINNTFSSAVLIYYYVKYGIFFTDYNEISAIASMYLVIAQEYPSIAMTLQLGKLIISNFSDFQKAFESVDTDLGPDITPLCYLFFKILSKSIKLQINEIKKKTEQIIDYRKRKKSDSQIEMKIKAHNLRLSNLNITKRQSNFFIAHKTIGHTYLIEDFVSFTSSSYETSRYSLDNLVQNGFYTKRKFRNKFVFEVVPEVADIYH